MEQTKTKITRRSSITSRLYLAGLLAVILSMTVASQTATAPATRAQQADNEYQTGAVLWMQSAGETRALRYQAYYLARLALDHDLTVNRRLRRKRAVVVDVDETVLDNSRYQAELVLTRQPYTTENGTAWYRRGEAEAIPGAVEFLRYAASRGVRVFYVTNRRPVEKEGTILNLQRLNFPDVSEQTVMIRTDAATKEPRRQQISRRYRIVLLVGDNLSDFSNVFEGHTPEERTAAVETARQQFGVQFIMLPNPMYGDWENVIYGSGTLSEEEKAIKRKAALKGY